MENNKGNKGTAASRTEEKTVQPSNNSDRDYVNQTGKSQNLGNDSDYLIDPNSKSKPENLVEGSEFLNDSVTQNNASDEKEADTQEFYNKGNEGSQNNMDKAPKSYDYIDSQDQRNRNNSSDSDDEDDDTQDPHGKVKSTMIDEEDDEDSADLDELQVRRNT